MKLNQNINQAAMADFLGVSQQYISRLLNNKIIPRLPKIKKFSAKTNTELSFWLVSTGLEKEKAIKKAISNKDEKAA
jgi:transcriptional regulator with XRE-family HTH domain